MIALTAYLQRLGTDIAKPAPVAEKEADPGPDVAEPEAAAQVAEAR